MYTFQVFRTKSKDYEEAFHKMENFVKEHNLSVADYTKSNGDKDILKELAILINIHEPEIEKYKELIYTPFEGDTIEDFGKYLFENIINISGNYNSSLDDLAEELYDFGLDDEADKVNEIHRMIEDHLEDRFSAISVRIYGCIDNENNIFNYPAEGEKNKLNPELMFLKSEEWSISVIRELFRENSGNESFDIYNDEWIASWIETGLHNLDDGNNVGNKTYFIVCYVKEVTNFHALDDNKMEDVTLEEIDEILKLWEAPLKMCNTLNASAWEKMECGVYDSALIDAKKSIDIMSTSHNNDTAAMIYFNLQDFDNALKYSNESIKLDGTPSKPQHLFTRAQILVKLGEITKAKKDLEDAFYFESDWDDGYEDAKKLLKEISKN